MPSKRISKRRTRRNNRTYKKVVRRINRTKKKHTMRKHRINRRKYSNRKYSNRKRTNRKQVRGGAGNGPPAATAPPQDQQDGYFTFKKAFYFFCSQIPLVSHSKSTSEKKKKEEDRDNEILTLYAITLSYARSDNLINFVNDLNIENNPPNNISICYLKYKSIEGKLKHKEYINSLYHDILKINTQLYQKKEYTKEEIFEIFISDSSFNQLIDMYTRKGIDYLKNLIFNYDKICGMNINELYDNFVKLTSEEKAATANYKPNDFEFLNTPSTLSLKDINQILQKETNTQSQEVLDLLKDQYRYYVDKVIKQSENVYNQYSDDKYRFSKNHISKCSVLLPVLKQASLVMSQGNYNDKLQFASNPEELVKLTDIREEQNKSVLLSYALKMIDSIIHDSDLESMIELSSPLLSDKTSTYMSYGLVPLGIAEYLEGHAGGQDAEDYKTLFKYLYYTLNTPLTHLLKIIDTFDLHIHKLITISRVYSQKYTALLGSLGAITLGGTLGVGPVSGSIPNIPVGWKLFNESEEVDAYFEKLPYIKGVISDYREMVKIGFIFMNATNYLNEYRESIHNLISLLSKYCYNLEIINHKFNFVDDDGGQIQDDLLSPGLSRGSSDSSSPSDDGTGTGLEPVAVDDREIERPLIQDVPEEREGDKSPTQPDAIENRPIPISVVGVDAPPNEDAEKLEQLTGIRNNLLKQCNPIIEKNKKDLNAFRMKHYHNHSKHIQNYRIPNVDIIKYGGPYLGPNRIFDHTLGAAIHLS